DFELDRRNRDAAIAALKGIDPMAAPALLLLEAATRAQFLRLPELRETMVQRALAKPAPLADQLEMAAILMSELAEVEAGEAIYSRLLAAADDDEQRARIRFWRADALRNREDLPENTGFEELEALARELPGTYWGGIARDRVRASKLRLGDPGIPFTAKPLAGEEVSLAALRGRPVVLAFWRTDGYGTEPLVTLLRDLRRRHETLAIVSICLDEDLAEVRRAVKSLGVDFPVVADGKGRRGEVPLRWFVEGEVVHVLDAEGRLVGMGLTAATNDGRRELRTVIDDVAG
ncbi:MAG TPA: redoxin domain-containing protein, partial [bacterium]|nr:redoxin domain-containing protein [bacterium]